MVRFRYKLEKTVITNDLSKERPLYTLSAYGPGRDAPRQLFGGLPREQSFEELRAKHYELAAQGKEQAAIQEAQQLVANAEQQMRTVLKDVEGAIKYIIDGESQHPNRIDVCKARGTNLQPPPGLGSGFAQSDPPNPFAQPAPMIAVSRPSGNTFGQPSALNARQSTTFGRPSTLGQNNPLVSNTAAQSSIFGQRSGPALFNDQQQSSSINQHPNPLFQSSTPFQSANAPQTSTQPSAGLFGRPSSGISGSTLGQPSAMIASSQQPQAPVNTSGPFSNSQSTTDAGLFGRPTASNPSTGVFGRPATQQSPNVSVQATASPNTLANANASRRPSTHLEGGGQAQRDGQGNLKRWNGHEVQYFEGIPCFQEGFNGEWQKIWFPDGPPKLTKLKDLPEDAYDVNTKEDYAFAKNQGFFKDSLMPLLPPRREWCNWNL